LNVRLFDQIAAAKDQADAEARVRQVAARVDPETYKADVDQALHYARSAYMRYVLTADPTPALRQLRIPVLALVGSKDLIVPPDLNLPAVRKALAGDRDVTVVELPGLNNFFRPAETGLNQEFSTIETTLTPQVIATILPWIARHTADAKRSEARKAGPPADYLAATSPAAGYADRLAHVPPCSGFTNLRSGFQNLSVSGTDRTSD
jgi:predicted dienelactone hydrolase